MELPCTGTLYLGVPNTFPGSVCWAPTAGKSTLGWMALGLMPLGLCGLQARPGDSPIPN